jgi:hypothetical protein
MSAKTSERTIRIYLFTLFGPNTNSVIGHRWSIDVNSDRCIVPRLLALTTWRKMAICFVSDNHLKTITYTTAISSAIL